MVIFNNNRSFNLLNNRISVFEYHEDYFSEIVVTISLLAHGFVTLDDRENSTKSTNEMNSSLSSYDGTKHI